MEVTNINSMGAGGSSGGVGSTGKKKDMGKDQFMTMLVAQMQNQDPLSPMEGTDFTAQLAQFSSLEEMLGVNKNLENMQMLQVSQNNSLLTSLIGKNVEASGNSTAVKLGEASDISYRLSGNAAIVDVFIRDSNGAVVRRMSGTGLSMGDHSVPWDGKNNSGIPLKDGEYSYTVSATSATGDSVKTNTFIKGQVSGVSFGQDGSSSVMVGALRLRLGNIVEISE